MRPDCRPLYAGQPLATEVYAYMDSLGYVPNRASDSCSRCECEVSFYRNATLTLTRQTSRAAHAVVSRNTATRWLKRASSGSCPATPMGVKGDCSAGMSGSLPLPLAPALGRGFIPTREKETTVRLEDVRRCLDECERCERCRYISVSSRWRDCSWYWHCDLSVLTTKVGGFHSGRV